MLLAVHYRVMEHLGSLESTQEARVALGYPSGNSYASFVLSKLPACSITRQCTLKREPIVNQYYPTSGLMQILHFDWLRYKGTISNSHRVAKFTVFSFVLFLNNYFFNLHLLTLLLPFCPPSWMILKQLDPSPHGLLTLSGYGSNC